MIVYEKDIILFAILLFPVVVNAGTSISISGNGMDTPRSSFVTNDGGMLVVGSTSSSNLFSEKTDSTQGAFIIKYSQSGNIEWKKAFNGSGDDYFSSVIELNDESIIVVGGTTSTDLDSAITGTGARSFIAKYNHNGERLKVVLLSKPINRLKTTDGVDVLGVSGYLNDTVGHYLITNGSLDDVTVHSYRVTHMYNDIFWQTNNEYGAMIELSLTNLTGIDKLSNGKYVFSGECARKYPNRDTNQAFILVLNEDHTVNTEYGIDAIGKYTDVAAAGNEFYTVGTISESIDEQTNAGGKDILISKYSSNGLVWNKTYGTTSNEYGTSVRINNDYLDVIGVTETNADTGAGKVFHSRYDLSGNNVKTIELSNSSDVILADGFFNGTSYSLAGFTNTNSGVVLYDLDGVADIIDDGDHHDALDPEENPDNPQPVERNPHTGTFVSVGVYVLFSLGFTVFAMKRGYNVIRKI